MSSVFFTQVVSFTNLAPIQDDVPATTVTIDGNDADNAIDYINGPALGIFTGLGLTTGLVTIDGFESYEFANKSNLVINGLGGDDTFNINNTALPTNFAGTVTVNGDDPSGSDTVIVNGTGAANNVAIRPNGGTSDSAVITGLAQTINVNTAEHLQYVGNGGNDHLTIVSPALTSYTFTPGATEDSGNIDEVDLSGGISMIPITYSTLGTGGSLNFTGAGGDFMSILGTAANDLFNVTNIAGSLAVQLISQASLQPETVPINLPTLFSLGLNGNGGDDTFNVPGNIAIAGGVAVQASGANSVLNFAGDGTSAVTADYGLASIQQTGFSAVSYVGIAVANIAANNNNLTIRGTLGSDVISATPIAAGSATVSLNSSTPSIALAPVINAIGVAVGGFLINLQNKGPISDELIVNGTQGADTIAANSRCSGQCQCLAGGRLLACLGIAAQWPSRQRYV